MGHALDEMNRVLKPDGHVVDIRPYRPAGTGNKKAHRPLITCLGTGQPVRVGALQQNPSDFRYTDHLLAEELRTRHRFKLIAHRHFYVSWYARSFEIFDTFLSTEWQSLKLGQSDRRRLKALSRQNPTMQIRIDMPVQLNILKKRTP